MADFRENIDFSTFKFRPSSIYRIMTCLTTITDKQLVTLRELAAQPKRTEKQDKMLRDLIAKRDKLPELPVGAISYLQEIYDDKRYDIREEISGKEIDKGNLCEEDVLGLAGNYLELFLIKNTETFSNDFIIGTPDTFINDRDIVFDVKASWNLRTFRGADLPAVYEWQLHAYMWLTGAKKGLLCYGLADTPEHLIQDELRKKSWSMGLIDEMSSAYLEMENKVRNNMTFSDRIPVKNRLKLFWVDRDEKKIEQMKMRVEMCRKKLAEIHKEELNYNPFQNTTDLTILEQDGNKEKGKLLLGN